MLIWERLSPLELDSNGVQHCFARLITEYDKPDCYCWLLDVDGEKVINRSYWTDNPKHYFRDLKQHFKNLKEWRKNNDKASIAA